MVRDECRSLPLDIRTTLEQLAVVQVLRNQGWTKEQIARGLACSPRTVQRRLRELAKIAKDRESA